MRSVLLARFEGVQLGGAMPQATASEQAGAVGVSAAPVFVGAGGVPRVALYVGVLERDAGGV